MVIKEKKEKYDLWDNENKTEEMDTFNKLINKKQISNESVTFTSEYNPFLSDEENEIKNKEIPVETLNKESTKEVETQNKEETVFEDTKNISQIVFEEEAKEELWSENEPDFLTDKLNKMSLKEKKHVTFSDSTETFLIEKTKFSKKETNFNKYFEKEAVNFSSDKQAVSNLLNNKPSTNLSNNKPSTNFFKNESTTNIPDKEQTIRSSNKESITSFTNKEIAKGNDLVKKPSTTFSKIEKSEPKINLIPKIYQPIKNENDCFYFNKSSKLVKISGYTIIGYPHTQKRVDFNTQQEKEVTNSKFVFFKNLTKYDFNKFTNFKEINDLLKLKEKTIDNICKIITTSRRNFIDKKVEENNNLEEINTILSTYFLNKEIAISLAVEKKIWHLALFMSDCNENVKNEYLKNYKENIRIFLGGNGEIGDDWKDNFELLLRNPNEKLLKKLIDKVNEIERLFILLSFYFVHENLVDCKVFFNNFYILNLLLENKILCKNLDKFIFRFLKILHEEGNFEAEKDFYEKNKKFLSRELIDSYENKKGWLTGFRNIIDKSIFKIVGVESKDDNLEQSKVIIKEDNKIIKEKEEIKNLTKTYKNYARKGSFNKINENFEDKIEEIKEEEVVEEKKSLYSNITPTTQSTVQLPTEEKTLYQEKSHAKSMDDFFKNEEDIPSLDTLVEKEKKQEEKPSFFSRFNIFNKKTQKHKVDLKGEADFVYDPLTKRWVNSSQKNKIPEIKEKKTPVKEIPKPSFQKTQTNFEFDGSITSRYVNKDVKKEENNSLKNFIPKPK